MYNARDTLTALRQCQEGQKIRLDFIHPMHSTVFAAAKKAGICLESLRISEGCRAFAATVGLLDVLEGGDRKRQGPSHGCTYSPLACLKENIDVNQANTIMTNTLTHQLGQQHLGAVGKIAEAIGELHDNVASHANGIGFSAAQVYGDTLQFAVADAGQGLLRNARRVDPNLANDQEAIYWCVKKSNTSAGHVSDLAQKVPDDLILSPFPPSVETRHTSNNHMGLGLYKTRRVVAALDGTLVIVSGDTEMIFQRGSISHHEIEPRWGGVIVGFSLRVSECGRRMNSSKQSAIYRRLASELGISL